MALRTPHSELHRQSRVRVLVHPPVDLEGIEHAPLERWPRRLEVAHRLWAGPFREVVEVERVWRLGRAVGTPLVAEFLAGIVGLNGGRRNTGGEWGALRVKIAWLERTVWFFGLRHFMISRDHRSPCHDSRGVKSGRRPGERLFRADLALPSVPSVLTNAKEGDDARQNDQDARSPHCDATDRCSA